MKVVSIVGVRPQFIKLSAVSRALRVRHQEVIVHTGQHYDFEMSDIFLRELEIPQPDYTLNVGSRSHAEQTGQMLIDIEKVLLQEQPDTVIVFGDTNSTLAGALAASKLFIPVIHVEAGLRSNVRTMPEEINRVITDHISAILCCPTQKAVENLMLEGIQQEVHWVGDVMYDAALYYSAKAIAYDDRMQIESGRYLLATIHRAANTDSRIALETLLNGFRALEERIIFPIHPRTKKAIQTWNLNLPDNVRVIEPVGYLEMLALEKNARMILTDSGGVQKEAFFFGVPCLTLRTETEWTELVAAGWNCLVGNDINQMVQKVKNWKPTSHRPNLYGNGNAAESIVKILENR